MIKSGLQYDMVPLAPYHMEWIPLAARPNLCEDTRGIVAQHRLTGAPGAICVMDNWAPNSCQIHIWIGNPLALRGHKFIRKVFQFIFGEASGRTKVLGITPSDNLKALKFNKHIGMKEIFRVKDGCEVGVDFVVTEMNKSECKWLNRYWHRKKRRKAKKRGQKASQSTGLCGSGKSSGRGKQRLSLSNNGS